jgi:hypothetical protein
MNNLPQSHQFKIPERSLYPMLMLHVPYTREIRHRRTFRHSYIPPNRSSLTGPNPQQVQQQPSRDARSNLHTMPLFDQVSQRAIHQPLLLQHVQPPEALRAHIHGVHGAAPARYVLHHELRWLEHPH